MRETKHRGKSVYSGDWFFGALLKSSSEDCYIWTLPFGGCRRVNPDTVGEYIGRCDREGNEIYEGDILEYKDTGRRIVAEWDKEELAYRAKWDASYYTDLPAGEELRIVGNIYDSPDLFEKSEPTSDNEDPEALLPGEFRIKGLYDNGCLCQTGVVYVARWLTRMDGPGKKGKIRIWEEGSYVKAGHRYGSYSDWPKKILTNYEAVPEVKTKNKLL